MNVRVIGERWFLAIRYGFSLFFIAAVLMAAILPHFFSWRDRRSIHSEVASNRLEIAKLKKEALRCPCHRNPVKTRVNRPSSPSTGIAPASSPSFSWATR